jgi:hypothetical protein
MKVYNGRAGLEDLIHNRLICKLLWGNRTFVPERSASHFERIVSKCKGSSLTRREGRDKGTSSFEKNNWMKSPRLVEKPLETFQASEQDCR